MILTDIRDGSWSSIFGTDFDAAPVQSFHVSVTGEGSGAIRVSLDSPEGPVVAYVPVESGDDALRELSAETVLQPEGVHDLYLSFAGSGYEVYEWWFE